MNMLKEIKTKLNNMGKELEKEESNITDQERKQAEVQELKNTIIKIKNKVLVCKQMRES